MTFSNFLKVVSTEFFEGDSNYTDTYELKRIEMTDPRPCDQEIHLYTLSHFEHTSFHNLALTKLPFSNLILIVVDDLMGNSLNTVNIEYPTPKEVVHSVALDCIRARGEKLIRRNYMECFNEVIVTVSY